MDASPPNLMGFSLSTHRPKDLGPDAVSYFQYESAVAALSVGVFRSTVTFPNEPILLRWFFSIILAFLAYQKQSHELITAVELFTYSVSYFLNARRKQMNLLSIRSTNAKKAGFNSDTKINRNGSSSWTCLLMHLLVLILSAVLSFGLSRFVYHGHLSSLLAKITPRWIIRSLFYLFPIQEFYEAYHIMQRFAQPVILNKQLAQLLFVTFHIQICMGFIGIDFLRREQDRRNQLVRMDIAPNENTAKVPFYQNQMNGLDDDESKRKNDVQEVLLERSRSFQRTAPTFILFTALPYMFQIIVYGNVNKFSFTCVQHELHRNVRLNELFEHDNKLMTMAGDSAISPDAYATSMGRILDISYEIWNRKLFSLPKILLLPTVMSQQPMLVVQVFPVIFASDWVKANVVSAMTRKVEDLEKELNDLRAVRQKVESFDIKNAELLQRSGYGSTQFTKRRWEDLTVKIQARLVVSDIIDRSKLFFSFIQRNFIFSVLIDCALANLMALRKIVSADTFVFSRAIEDTVDMLLMRSRAEADLARMNTEILKLSKLADTWDRSKTRALLHCRLNDHSSTTIGNAVTHHRKNQVILRNLAYNRGTAHVRADHIELDAGVYALTGSNGSGKSTLFRILMSCETNAKPIDLPASINLLTPTEPLCEEDDVRRESTCETIDDNDDDEMEGLDCIESVDVTTMGEVSVASNSRSLATQVKQTVPSIHPKLAISMPSSDVAEISQAFYWPLYSRPIEWIYQEEELEGFSLNQLREKAVKVADELRSLDFYKSIRFPFNETGTRYSLSQEDLDEAMNQKIISELIEFKEDWFSDLSGGQKSKVELVRKIFLHENCPDVLLVDETMAPLDPSSKSLVMTKLKRFCSESIVIVIYHTDVGRETTDTNGKATECVPSNDFFDKNINLESGIVHVRDVC